VPEIEMDIFPNINHPSTKSLVCPCMYTECIWILKCKMQ